MTNYDELRRQLRGTVIIRSEAEYEAARAGLLFNGRTPERYPGVIVRAADTADVQTVVRFAAKHGLRVSPRGSGHNFSGIALQDGIVLDLSTLNDVRIDAATRIAEVGPVVDNRTLARCLGEKGLAFPLGHCGHVAISGYLLGGGLGWNSERWGFGCQNVLSIDVVTADSKLLRASETENADLFWAARGAGPAFFGVVTGYRLALHKLPQSITTAIRSYPIERAADVQKWIRASKAQVPDNVEFTALMLPAPPHLAEQAAHVVMGVATCFAETAQEARAALDTIAALAPVDALEALEMPTPFDALYDSLDRFFPEGARYAVDTTWAAAPADDYFAKMSQAVASAPGPGCFALAMVLPQPDEMPQMPDTAFSMVGLGFGAIYAIWQDPDRDAAHVAWMRAAADRVADQTIGHYVGEADLERPGRLAGSFSPEAWNRISGLRNKYDPHGMFLRFQPGRQPARLAG
ncbi:FAD-binding oxidoreductase [Roseibium sp. M-1]